MLPKQATRAARTVSLWVEKSPVPPPSRQALDWSELDVRSRTGGACQSITTSIIDLDIPQTAEKLIDNIVM